MSTKTSARRTVARLAMAGAVAAIPFTLAAAPASAEPTSPSVTEVRHDKWDRHDKHDRNKWDKRDCRNNPWESWNRWDDKCDRWPGHNPWGPPFWRPFPSGSFGSS